MGYEGPAKGSKPGLFTDLVDHISEQVTHTSFDIMDEVGGHVLRETRQNTPVSEQRSLYQQLFGSNTSPFHVHLRELIRKKRTLIVADSRGRLILETGAETDVEYAPYVEEGTGLWGPNHAPYIIRPKKPGGTLHWITKEGQHVFAKQVVHPGSPGNYMFALGVFATEMEFEQVAADAMANFKRRCEAYRNGPI